MTAPSRIVDTSVSKALASILVCLIWVMVIYAQATDHSRSATLTFGGDVLLGGYYNSPDYGTMDRLVQRIDAISRSGGAKAVAESLFQHIAPLFQEADFAVVNLEGPITPNLPTEDIEALMIEKLIPVRQHQSALEILSCAGVDLVSLANNHMYDYLGSVGLRQTLDYLDRCPTLDYVGAGYGLDAYEAQIVGIKNIQVAFFGITDVMEPDEMLSGISDEPGVAGLPGQSDYSKQKQMRRLVKNIKATQDSSDFVVVMLHAGHISGSQVNERQVEIVDVLFEAGVDVVVGAHSHSKQAVRESRDADGVLHQVAFYGLGNLVFGGKQGAQTLSSIAEVTLIIDDSGKNVSYEMVDIYPNPDTTYTPQPVFKRN